MVIIDRSFTLLSHLLEYSSGYSDNVFELHQQEDALHRQEDRFQSSYASPGKFSVSQSLKWMRPLTLLLFISFCTLFHRPYDLVLSCSTIAAAFRQGHGIQGDLLLIIICFLDSY